MGGVAPGWDGPDPDTKSIKHGFGYGFHPQEKLDPTMEKNTNLAEKPVLTRLKTLI